MAASPIPQDLPREEALMIIIARLHRRWRMVIAIPMIYVLIGIIVSRVYFVPHRDGRGLLALSDATAAVLLFAGGSFVVFLWYLQGRFHKRQVPILASVRQEPNDFLRKAQDLQLAQFIVCDLVALPGIIVFLLDGDLVPLFAFALMSSVFYLRALPSGYWLGKALLLGGGSD